MQDHYLANLLMLVVLLPLFSACLLMLSALFSVKLSKTSVTLLAVGCMALAAILVLLVGIEYSDYAGQSFSYRYANWIEIGQLRLSFGFYLDPLSLVMIAIVTGVGFLIHLFSIGFMQQDADFQRFFIYLNLFISAMLTLVLADNLLLLFLGWEGVGLCSYLLIGFWHQQPANILAANKAFIMTRIGDAALAIALLLLFLLLGSLNIQEIQLKAVQLWPLDDNASQYRLDWVSICALLLLVGAIGKSGQFPLHTWLPDAMAGPTPVSALIHAATMVTAGVYLIARFYQLFNLSPLAMLAVASIGAITLILAATAALVQSDLKRILAYSTISQIGYMFLALGAGAYSAAVFHLMTHAFFKALLFLSAGALVYSLGHQQNIFRMGGLAKKTPFICACFLAGCAALSALPFMSGYFSKDFILESLLQQQMYGFWVVAIIGAFITAFYSFRLFFLIFCGDCQLNPDKKLPTSMIIPLALLLLLSVFGGIMPAVLNVLFEGGPALLASVTNDSLALHLLTIATPISAVLLCWLIFRKHSFSERFNSSLTPRFKYLLFMGWGIDRLQEKIFTQPFVRLCQANKNDFIDRLSQLLSQISQYGHRQLQRLQNGKLRWYAASLILSAIVALLSIVLLR